MRTHHSRNSVAMKSDSTIVSPTKQATITDGEKYQSTSPISSDDIRLLAYKNWEKAGKPAGDGIQFWLEAEHELSQTKLKSWS